MTAGLAAFRKYVGSVVPEAALQVTACVISFLMVSLLFALMFKWLPDVAVEWRDVCLGAIGTAGLFETGSFSSDFRLGAEFTHSQAKQAGRAPAASA